MSTPLRFERFYVRGFRNLARLDFTPGPRFNVIHGDNGAGKSNLLEALHYTAALRSFRGARADSLQQMGMDTCVIKARVAGERVPRTYQIGLETGRARKLKLDEKRPRSIAAWHATIHVVLFHPGDLELATGTPDRRRAFLDRMLEQMDPAYGPSLKAYGKALRSRNRLLKQLDGGAGDTTAIRSYDPILAQHGEHIGRARAALVDELGPRAMHAFHEVAGMELPLEVHYRPRVAPEAEVILQALHDSFRKDCARGFTADGPHGDDLSLEVRSVAAKHHASQGQQRAIVLALKVAELDELTRRTGKVPVLLLDDVSSELDRGRNRRLFEMLSRLGGQVFLTTTHPEFILLDEHRQDFRVEAGVVTPDG